MSIQPDRRFQRRPVTDPNLPAIIYEELVKTQGKKRWHILMQPMVYEASLPSENDVRLQSMFLYHNAGIRDNQRVFIYRMYDHCTKIEFSERQVRRLDAVTRSRRFKLLTLSLIHI